MLGLELPVLHLLFLPKCLQILAIDMTAHYPPAFRLSYLATVNAAPSLAIFLLFSLLWFPLFVLFLSVILS